MAVRPKPAMAAWIARERKRLGLKPAEVAARLRAFGLEASEQTVRVWESYANRSPSPDNIDGLERIFGTAAPSTGPAGDLSTLVSTMQELIDELRLARVERDTAQQVLMQALAAALDRPGTPRGAGRGTPEHIQPDHPSVPQQ